MKRKICMLTAIFLMVGLLITPLALAAQNNNRNVSRNQKRNQKRLRAGKSNIAHLYLYEKNPADWTIVEDGAWGKMKYNISGDTLDFVFNGHALDPGVDYTLIYYPDPWPGQGLICLGDGKANDEGNVHIMGSADIANLPIETDENDGAKIWLVLTGDVNCGTETSAMTGWNPTEYLFEYELITFNAEETPGN